MSKGKSFFNSVFGTKLDPENSFNNVSYNSNDDSVVNVPPVIVPPVNVQDGFQMNNNDKVEWTNTDPDRLERQIGALCGKHAINHVLQEEKIVLRTDLHNIIGNNGTGLSTQFIDKETNGPAPIDSDPKDINIQLNLLKYCDIVEVGMWQESGMSTLQEYRNTDVDEYGNNIYVPVCDENYQNLKFDGITEILRILGYRYYHNHSQHPNFWNDFRERLVDNQLLGVILNLGEGHYTAISKYLKNCKTWQRIDGRLESVSFSYIDSMGPTTKTSPLLHCLSLNNLIKFLRSLKNLSAVIYVYDEDHAYPSVALRRLRHRAVINGGRHTKHRHTKHRHTKHRHNKRCRTKHHRRVSKRTRKSRK